jgi:dihydrofolate reductase
MLSHSMGVSVDGFVTDRDGGFDWTTPTDDTFAFHLELVSAIGVHLLGRGLYETMRVWETDSALRSDPLREAFADVWCAMPKVVFSRTLERVEGNARLAEGTLAEEVAAARAATDQELGIGGADLAGQAFTLGLVDELRVFRYPIVVGGGTPYLPAVTEDVELELIETRTFGGRVVFERYRRSVRT